MTTSPITHSVAIACDHAGFDYKEIIIAELETLGITITDLGTHSSESVDYPDYGHKMAETILSGTAEMGILICGTGIGISISANRHAGIRCGVCHNEFTARATRQHNDANVLSLGSRVIDKDTAITCLRTFLTTEFEGGRHAKRVEKMG